jgi:hypothetical protein
VTALVSRDGQLLDSAELILTFAIPPHAADSVLAVRRLEEDRWVEVAGVLHVGDRIQAGVGRPGTYVLVSRPLPQTLDCDTVERVLQMGEDVVVLYCQQGSEALLWAESEATLPALIPPLTVFVSAITVRSPARFRLELTAMEAESPILFHFEAGAWVEVAAADFASGVIRAEVEKTGTYLLIDRR